MYAAGSRRQPHPSEWPGHSAARVPVPVRRSRTRAHRVGCDCASRLRPAPPRPRGPVPGRLLQRAGAGAHGGLHTRLVGASLASRGRRAARASCDK